MTSAAQRDPQLAHFKAGVWKWGAAACCWLVLLTSILRYLQDVNKSLIVAIRAAR